jgi:ArsR family transcriptional regulator
MVLHHMPSPEAFFQQAARVMTAKGHLVVAELCGHTQDWVTNSVGDLWLGFEPSELVQWAQQHGFRAIEQQHLAQRNGFQVQVLSFQRNA